MRTHTIHYPGRGEQPKSFAFWLQRKSTLGVWLALAAGWICLLPSCGGGRAGQTLPEGYYSTFLGGSKSEMARDVVVDTAGNIYVTGGTTSRDFPTTPGSYDSAFNTGGTQLGTGGEMDVFVSKFSAQGTLVCSTYLGGPNYDRAYAIEVDSKGDIVVAGRAGAGFPVTTGAIQPKFLGDTQPSPLYGPQDGFVAKISGDCTKLIWSTYLGDEGPSIVRDIAVDQGGNVYAACTGSSSSSHVTKGAFQTQPKAEDGVFLKISSDGKRVLYGTYLGGSSNDGIVPSVRVDATGSAYVLMGTESRDAPVSANAMQKTYGGGASDFFLAKFSPDGASLVFATYAGGSGDEGGETHFLAIDRVGNSYLTGATSSTDLPVSADAFQKSFRGKHDAFIVKVSADGARLLAGTYLGGSEWEHGEGIEVDEAGNIYVEGATESADFPTTPNALKRKLSGKADAWLAKFSPDLKSALLCTLFGGTRGDWGRSMTIDGRGNAYLVGATDSPDFPTSSDAFQARRTGYKAFLTKIPTAAAAGR